MEVYVSIVGQNIRGAEMTKRRKSDVRMTWQELIELWKLLNKLVDEE